MLYHWYVVSTISKRGFYIWPKAYNAAKVIIGATEAPKYDFKESRVARDGGFVGLALDFDNHGDEVDSRISNWCDQIRANFS